MPVWILTNWKTILAVILTAGLAYGLHALDVYRLEDEQRAAVAAQLKTDTEACDKAKEITKGVSDGLQKNLDDLSLAYAAVKRVRPNACVVVRPANATKRNDAATGSAIPARPDGGVNSDDLYAFANDAETDRLKLTACQSFITQTWAASGQ